MEHVNKAIQVSNLTFAYNGSSVLNNVSFEIEAGSLCFILGQNGTGKSTLLKIIAGLLKNQSGTVNVFGNNNSKLSYTERAKIIGFLNQQHKAVFPFSVEDVVLTGRAAYINYIPKDSDKKAVNEAIEKLESNICAIAIIPNYRVENSNWL
ncbi:MAG: ABC transporter ATP-binding protein [Bacteroidales bacterium]|nr:ABC transporter ATP-binding protein [Bacteroidales bacterium]